MSGVGNRMHRAEVAEAVRIAQAEQFVMERDGGFDSYVAQGGTNLSGGQKQRLSIARAIARKPRVYLLDDTFSALDYKTDARLRTELAKYAADAAVIVVAQRVSTILHADQIIVLDNGRIVGKGRHDELLADCRVYQKLQHPSWVRRQYREQTQTGTDSAGTRTRQRT